MRNRLHSRRLRGRLAVVAGVLVAAAIGGPATAEAGTVTKVYGVWPNGQAYYYLRFAAAPGENNHLSVGTVAGEIRFQDSYPITSFTAGTCHTVPPSDPGKPGGVGCTIAGLTELQLLMGSGANEATVVGSQRTLMSGVGASTNEFTGGSGQDWIFGAGGRDILRGGAGTDRLEARGGNDELHGGSGADLLKGEEGTDSLDGGKDTDADVMSGGLGVDTVTYGPRSTAVNVSLNAIADDGAPGENDYAQPDIERVLGGAGNDTIVAQAGDFANLLDGAPGNDSIVGGGGPDDIIGRAGDDDLDGGAGSDAMNGGDDADLMRSGPGADFMAGGAGRDTVSYATSSADVSADLDGEKGDDGTTGEQDSILADVELLIGSPFADTLIGNGSVNEIRGGGGADLIVGRAAQDRLFGEGAGDSIRSADGTVDDVDCGDGNDSVDSDAVDRLTACEAKAGGQAGGGGSDGPGATGGSQLRIGPARVRLTGHGVARLRVACAATATGGCKGTLRLRRKIAGKVRTIGSRRFSIAAGRRGVVRVRVDRAVRRRLTEAGLRVRAVARTSDAASASRSVGRFIRILPARAR
jgi:Ca2+-binding RTX toxin-like protein